MLVLRPVTPLDGVHPVPGLIARASDEAVDQLAGPLVERVVGQDDRPTSLGALPGPYRIG